MILETQIGEWTVLTVSKDEPGMCDHDHPDRPFETAVFLEEDQITKASKGYDTETEARYGHFQFVEHVLAKQQVEERYR